MRTWKKILLTICLVLAPTLFFAACDGNDPGTTPPTEHTVTVEKNIDEAGTVTGGGTYTRLATATLTATTNLGYTFDGWYGEEDNLLSSYETYSFQVKKSVTYTAKWSVTDVSVRFDTGGACVIATQDISYGEKATKPADPIKMGYDFVGWYNGSTAWDFNTAVTQNITLTAHWSIQSYAVTFDTAGGNAIAPQTVEYNQKATKPADPTKTGYTFAGWDFDFNTPITGNKTITATWMIDEYVVTFKVDGETYDTQTVAYDATASAPTAPTKAGETFSHWSLAVGGDAYDFATKITGEITLHAVFTTNVYTLTVVAQVNDNGNTGTPTATATVTGGGRYEYGTEVTLTATPGEGCVFMSWNDGEGDATRTVVVTESKEYRAIFRLEIYNLTFENEDSSCGSLRIDGSIQLEYGTPLALLATPNAGYLFDGWYEEGTLVSADASYEFVVTANRHFVAKWKAQKFSITATASTGGTVTGGGEYAYGTEVTLTATPSTGYVFGGWSDGNANATRTVEVTGTATYTATFTKKTYTISTGRSPTAGGMVTGGGTYEHGDGVTLTATTNSAYNFLGWYDGSTKVSSSATYTFTATANKTYTAKWEAKTPVTTTMKALQTAGKLKILGRTLYEGDTLVLRNSASGFEVYTTASYLKMNASVSGLFSGEYMNVKVWVDGVAKVINLTSTSSTTITLAEGLTAGTRHHIKLAKMNEALGVGAEHANNCNIYVQSLTANYDGEIQSAPAAGSLKIEIYGDSITCGYGALGNVANNPTNFDTREEDATETFAYKTAMALGADINVVAHQGWAIGQSRWGTEEKPLRLTDIYDKVTDAHEAAWDFSSYTPDIVIVSLGTNDFVNSGTAIPGDAAYNEFVWKYYEFLRNLEAKYANAKFVLCYGMMDSPGGALEHAIATWMPVACSGQAGDNYTELIGRVITVDLTGADGTFMGGGGSHPSAAQHTVAAANLQAALRAAGWI